MEPIIWSWSRGFYKVYVEDYYIKKQILGWNKKSKSSIKVHCLYFHQNGKKAWDIIFPSKYYNRIAKLVGEPQKRKTPNRVLAGKRTQEQLNKGVLSKVKLRNLRQNQQKSD